MNDFSPTEIHFARFFSILFHPLLVPVLGFSCLLFFPGQPAIMLPTSYKWLLIALIFISTAVIPGLVIRIMKWLHIAFPSELVGQNREGFSFIIVLICYYFTYKLLQRLGLDGYMTSLLMGFTATLFILTLTRLQWNISLHAAAAGSLFSALASFTFANTLYEGFLLLPLLLICGIVASSRLILHKNSPAQVYAGLLTGIMVNPVLYFLLT
ncbi:MAG: hypothetical protein M0O94_05360 [Bacteroidales bacterium]|nr:hypothetical protein [Bacteroidales bacterium]MDD3960377.1 hypothetical protein [Bacteroidales bacterium]MDY0286465.1 hypothetical protein [Bacteroidales bacterium]HPE86638.1 hypothetical protein [Bacteroidales bacterium]